MIRCSLFTKLLATYMIVIMFFLLILTGVTSFFYHKFFTSFYTNLQLSRVIQLAGILEKEEILVEGRRTRQKMVNAYAGLMGSRVWLLDTGGGLLAGSTGSGWMLTLDDKSLRPPRLKIRFRRERVPDFLPPELTAAARELLGRREPVVQVVEKQGFPPQDLIAYAPVYQEGRIAGGVILHSPLAPVTMVLRGNRRFLWAAAGVAFIVSVILCYILSRRITGHLRKMRQAALAMTEGDFTTRIQVTSRDEVGELAGSFNHLARELENKISELSREKERITTIIANMSEGVIGIDGEGMVVFVNPRAGELLRHGVRETEEFSSLYRQKIRYEKFIPYEELQHVIREVLEEGKPGERVLGIPPGAPKQVILSVRAEPITTGRGRLGGRREGLSSGCVTVLADITDQWKYQQMQKDFVANVSHELKTPLALIQGYLEAIMDGLTGEPGSKERFLDIMHQETTRLKRMVNDLLVLAALDRGEERAEPVSLETVVRNMLALAEKEAAKKNIRLVLAVQPQAPGGREEESEDTAGEDLIVMAGYDHLAQVVLNLLDNAVNCSQPDSRVFVRIGKAGGLSPGMEGFAYLSVEDEGNGIPRADLPYIWDRFYRVKKDRGRKQGGTGLGLAIVKRIAEFYGGKVAVRSEEGKGSVFTCYVPLAGQEEHKGLS